LDAGIFSFNTDVFQTAPMLLIFADFQKALAFMEKQQWSAGFNLALICINLHNPFVAKPYPWLNFIFTVDVTDF
jgi:hypothetical protein